MSIQTYPLRHVLRKWIADTDYTHAITLNTDRELTLPRLKSIFGTFCHEVDRIIHDRKNVRRIPTAERFSAIAFPEHLETNAHLHVSADLSPLRPHFLSEALMADALQATWLRSTRNAGSFHMFSLSNMKWASYQTKDARGRNPDYFLAADFHPL